MNFWFTRHVLAKFQQKKNYPSTNGGENKLNYKKETNNRIIIKLSYKMALL